MIHCANESLRCLDLNILIMAIFVLTTMTQLITLPLVHAQGLIILYSGNMSTILISNHAPLYKACFMSLISMVVVCENWTPQKFSAIRHAAISITTNTNNIALQFMLM